MDYKQVTDQLKKELDEITNAPVYVDVTSRIIQGMELTSQELDRYMQSQNLLGLGDAWIELSHSSSIEMLEGLLETTSLKIHFKDPNCQTQISNIVAEFLSLFTNESRYFCNGIPFKMREYPLNEKKLTMVLHPFHSNQPMKSLIEAWKSFHPNPDDDAFGVVAVDKNTIGFFLINTLVY